MTTNPNPVPLAPEYQLNIDAHDAQAALIREELAQAAPLNDEWAGMEWA